PRGLRSQLGEGAWEPRRVPGELRGGDGWGHRPSAAALGVLRLAEAHSRSEHHPPSSRPSTLRSRLPKCPGLQFRRRSTSFFVIGWGRWWNRTYMSDGARLFHTASAILLALTGACYSGVSSFHPLGEGVGPLGEDADEPEDEPGDPISASFEPDAPQIRLLSAREYANTVRDLLGVEPSSTLAFGEVGSGYDNGSEGQLGESLFSILHTEAERLASEYVSTGMAQEFPCFDPGGALASSCVETIVEQLGRRAFRRPVDPETRQQLLEFVADATPQ